MSAQIGGGYNALVSKKSKGAKKDAVQADGRSTEKRPAQNTSSQPAARREAKVLSLKESNAVQGKKDYKPPVPEEPKKEAPKKEPEPVAKKTTAEEKKEREKTDRHVPRSGKSPARGHKGEDSAEVVAAEQSAEASDDPAAAAAERALARLTKEEEEAKKQREEEERQITYEDYQKKRAEAAKGLPQTEARELDESKYKKFTAMKKDSDDAALSGFGKKVKAVAPPPPKPAAKAGKKGAAVVQQPKAKSKPKKMDGLLSFTVSDEPTKTGKGKGKGKGGGKGDGPRVPRGGPEWDTESKVDSDGVVRTKREFVTKYGGFAEWDKAGAQGADTAADATPAADPEPEPETW